MPAPIALEEPPAFQFAVSVMATLRVDKALWPAPLKKMVLALFFGTELSQKILQTETLLKLNLILRHVKPSM